MARANLAAMMSNMDHGFFNIGTGTAISIKDLANLMIKILEKDLEPTFDQIPDGDVRLSLADISLAKKMLDWQSITTLEDGLRTMF